MARVPRVIGRSIKLNPLPDTTQKLNAPAAAFGIDLSPALKNLERLFEQTSNPQKKAAPAPGDSQDDAEAAPIDPQDAIIIDRLQADMAAAGDMFTRPNCRGSSMNTHSPCPSTPSARTSCR